MTPQNENTKLEEINYIQKDALFEIEKLKKEIIVQETILTNSKTRVSKLN